MERLNEEMISKLKKDKYWVTVESGNFVYNSFLMLRIVNGEEVDRINGQNVFHSFYVGLKVEENDSVKCDFYNTNGEFVTSTDGRKMLSPNTIDVFDLSMAIADEIVTNEKEDVLSRVPKKFIKAYPNLKQMIALKFSDYKIAKTTSEKGLNQIKEIEKAEKHQTSTLLRLEKIGWNIENVDNFDLSTFCIF